jgi:hypothetical protein
MCAVMRLNMLPFVPRLNDEDWKVIAFAMCRKGYLTKYPHFLEAATKGRYELWYSDRDVVRAALRELVATPDAASFHPAAHDAIRKLA